jgi:hypothetical protein
MPTLPASKRGGKKAAPASNVIPIPTLYAEAHRWTRVLGHLLRQSVTSREEARALHDICDMALSAIEHWGDGRMLLTALRRVRALRAMADAACEPAEVVQIGAGR